MKRSFWKKSALAAGTALVLVTAASPASAHWLYEDIDGVPWAQDSLISTSQMRVIDGVSEKTFDPGAKVTGIQFVKMAVMANDPSYEPDLGSYAAWYGAYLNKAQAEIGLVDEAFQKTMLDPASRLEIVRVVSKLIQPEWRFKSVPDEDAVALCVKEGILQGRAEGDLALEAPVTRAEAAVLIDRVMEKTGKYGKRFDKPVVGVEGGAFVLNGLYLGQKAEEVTAILGTPFLKGQDELDGDAAEEYKNFYIAYYEGNASRIMYKAVDEKLQSGDVELPGAAVFKGFDSTYYYLEQSEEILMVKDQSTYLGFADGNFYFHVDNGGIQPYNEAARKLNDLFEKHKNK
ncbi:S-layer homology domain-containing protein [Paenibacillus chitinolyticus]|uniref:S-layer homology domain-containing protein n=1 Tax=Paenibacillus chitinolyticus TaxID=79263 RepID=A0A410WS34_9BACL|nr:S-layer homology domain-containing protein [Paenibacillus chitinolyticus]MCY9589002.1 S-layer homology domain-containing protein [Paenibacillus chitinolyticus]MCY9595456.1 S-layer homology domain-containing protein [Paenibacillus chitinolyticus]QAV17229.1 S-layer homology domain-containing protein [Paenibacillus chitinolyticus]